MPQNLNKELSLGPLGLKLLLQYPLWMPMVAVLWGMTTIEWMSQVPSAACKMSCVCPPASCKSTLYLVGVALPCEVAV